MISRRQTIGGVLGLGLLAACTPAAVTTDVAAGLAAAQAIAGIASTLKSVSLAGLTTAQVQSVGASITQLEAIAATLTAASQPAAVSSAASAVSGVLADIAAFLPDVTALLPLLALVRAEDEYLSMIVLVADAPKAKMTAEQVTMLKAKLAALAAAVAKAKAGS